MNRETYVFLLCDDLRRLRFSSPLPFADSKIVVEGIMVGREVWDDDGHLVAAARSASG
jgi:hypothetical protein